MSLKYIFKISENDEFMNGGMFQVSAINNYFFNTNKISKIIINCYYNMYDYLIEYFKF